MPCGLTKLRSCRETSLCPARRSFTVGHTLRSRAWRQRCQTLLSAAILGTRAWRGRVCTAQRSPPWEWLEESEWHLCSRSEGSSAHVLCTAGEGLHDVDCGERGVCRPVPVVSHTRRLDANPRDLLDTSIKMHLTPASQHIHRLYLSLRPDFSEK